MTTIKLDLLSFLMPFFIHLVSLMIFITPISVKANSFDDALKYANSLRDKVKIEGNTIKVKSDNGKVKPLTFEPKEVFKDQKRGYTENPKEINHYQESKAGDSYGLEKAAVMEVDRDEDYKDSKGNNVPTPGKIVTKSFSTREVFKITPESEYMKKGQLVKNNARNILGGVPNENVDCENKKKTTCEATYIEKTCNEEIREVQRICEKIPYVTLVDEPYPGCRRHTSPGPIEDCLAGEVKIPHYRGDGSGWITVPRNRGSRVTFGDCKHGYYYVTIVNETTGQRVIKPRTRVNNNEYIELPFSKNKDQVFSFIAHRSDGCSCNRPGSLHVYFNYIRKIPKIEWKEELCRDV